MVTTRHPREHSNLTPLLLVIGVVAVMYFARTVLVPLAFALTLSFLLAPFVSALQRLRLPRMPAVLVVLILAALITGGVAWQVGDQLVSVATELPKYRQNIRAKIQALRSPRKGALAQATENVKQMGQEFSDTPAAHPAPGAPRTPLPAGSANTPPPARVQIVEPEMTSFGYLRDVAGRFLAPLTEIGVVLVFTVFMLIQREDLRNRILRLAGVGRLNVATQALEDAAQRVSRYLLLQFAVNAGFGFLFGFGLYFIGVPSAFLWAAVAAIFRFVPYVGTLAAAALPLMLSLAVFDSWVPPLLVLLLYALLEFIVGNFLEPWLYGVHTGISSIAILVTSVFWAVLWGVPGLILSTPLTVCAVVLGRYVPQLGFLHVLLGEESVLAPEEQYYQRLLALDQHEAHAVADHFLQQHSLVQLYDSVLLPALGLAEQDRHQGALDSSREEYLFLNIGEMIAEYSEHIDTPVAAATGDVSSDSGVAGGSLEPQTAKPVEGLRVLCFPARDEADAITAAMVAQLLERNGFSTICMPLGTPLEDLRSLLGAGSHDAICICALPPFAFAHARTLFKQLSKWFPDVPTVVGIWGFAGDLGRAKVHFARDSSESLVVSLAEALARLTEIRERTCKANASCEALSPQAAVAAWPGKTAWSVPGR